MKKSLDIEFEKARQFIEKYFPKPKEGERKPVLSHSIRVGTYLLERNYSRDIVLAGLFHDALEFSEITQQLIKEEFGENVAKLVKACTKDRSIKNSDERIEELAKRAAEVGKDALIVRAADTIDSFKCYTETGNQPELEYCRKNAEAIAKYKPADIDDPIFGELNKW